MAVFKYEMVPVFTACNGLFSYASQAFLKIVGYDLDDIKDQKLFYVIHPSSYEKMMQGLEKAQGKSMEFDVQVTCKNKNEKWLNLSVSAELLNDDLNLSCFVCEISKYKAQIETKEIIEAQYADILDNMTEEVSREDQNGRITYVNQAYCDYYGITKETAIGRKGTDVVIPEDRQKYSLIGVLTPANPFYKLDCRVKKATGEIAWIQCSGRAFFNQAGEFIELHEVGRDITELKKLEDDLLERKDELESRVNAKTLELLSVNNQLIGLNSYLNNILQNISEGVAVFNAEGNLMQANAFLEQKWGSLLPSLVERFRNDIINNLESPLSKMIRERLSFTNYEMIFETADKNLQCLVSGAPLEEKIGELGQGVIIIRAISEIHQLVNRYSGFHARFNFSDIITKAPAMITAVQYAQAVAKNQMNIMIEGESGTGKEMFAQSIHNASNRRRGPFIGVNCGAIPCELIGSELFGYADGAFTGAKKGGKPGKFELASGGTIFLDEIADMPLAQQVALLRVIQEKAVVRVGGEREIPIDARIICATNKDLLEEVKKGNFRQDLYYRLNVISLKIPPLRERIDDLPMLIQYFYEKLREKGMPSVIRLDPIVLGVLFEYDWPGNVRELQNIVERTLYMSGGQDIMLHYLPQNMKKHEIESPDFIDTSNEIVSSFVVVDAAVDYTKLKEKNQQIFNQQEKAHITALLNLFDNNTSIVARKLGVSRNTLYRKLKKYQIE